VQQHWLQRRYPKRFAADKAYWSESGDVRGSANSMPSFLGGDIGMGTRPIQTVSYHGHKVPVSKYLEAERSLLKREIEIFQSDFSRLEHALSTLLHATLRATTSKVPLAVYYSITGFDGRATMVENALIELISEEKRLAPLAKETRWPLISKRLRKIRILRNAIAHGSLENLYIGNRPHVRWIPPASDVIRVSRIIAKRQIPGLTAEDVLRRRRALWPLIECLDAINLLVRETHQRSPALQERFRALAQNLKVLRNLYPSAQKNA
jgi:hypothetical protein